MSSTIPYGPLSEKHKRYIKNALVSKWSVAEGSIRTGKTIDGCLIAAILIDISKDRFHLASGSTIANAKLNIGDCNGFGLEYIFRGRCRWGKYRDNECLFVNTKNGTKVVIFAGGGKADSYKKILGNSYGVWIATEINEHYDCDDSRSSFIKVALGRQVAAHDPRIIWDMNPCAPNHKIYKDYIDKFAKDGLIGGYNYEHFTLADNLTITPQRRKEIESQYNPLSVWFKRDILGLRVAAEGLCFQQFADNPDAYNIKADQIPPLEFITGGVDFGGNGSKHAFTCVGFTKRLQKVVVLKSARPEAKGVSAEELARKFCDFYRPILERYGKGIIVYCDNEEQTLMNQLRVEVARQHLQIDIQNARKRSIIDRIRLHCNLIEQKRLLFVQGETQSVQDALCTAVWDPKAASVGKDIRLDDGTSDIDSCDSLEYNTERYLEELIAVKIINN